MTVGAFFNGSQRLVETAAEDGGMLGMDGERMEEIQEAVGF